ncbi:MAG: NUDIX hydrolase [Tissierellales bacterium]|jgi:8-oxo-dGTP pyrophosphatase MutT (NUDIX family)|nr:NUDIX hydrolase [Tissierellales bacterium]
MKTEVSAGGVVVFGNTILLLKKYNGDWVLPKGRVEIGEELFETALREVYEETKVKAELVEYLGKVHYQFKNGRDIDSEIIYKTVHWYLMHAKNMQCAPLNKEGFVEAKFIHMDKVLRKMKYTDERKIIKRALKKIKEE